MKLKRQITSALMATGGLLVAVPTSVAFAKTSSTAINSVSLTIKSNIEDGNDNSDLEITTSQTGVKVEDYEITNEPDDEWSNGDKPKVKITLEINDEDNYYFDSSLKKDNVSISFETSSDNTSTDKPSITKVSRSSKTKAVVYVTLPKIGNGEYDLDLDDLQWQEDSSYAYWEGADDAKYYEVKVFRDDKLISSSSVRVYDEGVELGAYFTKAGTYTFKARAVYNNSNKGEWQESDSLTVSTTEAQAFSSGKELPTSTNYISNNKSSSGSNSKVETPSTYDSSKSELTDKQGAWNKDSNGWWWLNPDRTWPKNTIQEINGKSYFFNNEGYMVTGWIHFNNADYYAQADGEILKSTYANGYKLDENGKWVVERNTWTYDGKDWFYCGADGVTYKNRWVQTNGVWYYCGQDGRMLTNTTTPDGYKVNNNGVWVQ